MTPDEVAAGIAAALNARDVEGVRALTTDAGWTPTGGSVRAMAEASAKRPPPPIRAFGSVVEDDRAVAGLVLEAGERVIGKVWVLCERVGDGWKAAGMAQVAPHAGLYLSGALPPVWDWRSKPPSPEAERWAEGFIADLTAGRTPAETRASRLVKLVSGLVDSGIQGGTVTGSHHLDELDRAVVLFSLRARDEDHDKCVVVDLVDGQALPVTLTPGPSAAAFFVGMGWDRDIDDEPEVDKPGRGAKR